MPDDSTNDPTFMTPSPQPQEESTSKGPSSSLASKEERLSPSVRIESPHPKSAPLEKLLTSGSRSMDKAGQLKEAGNAYFASQKYEEARDAYRSALDIVEEIQKTKTKDKIAAEEQQQEQSKEQKQHPTKQEWDELEVALRSNLAIVLLRLKDFYSAQEECTKALELDRSNPKVWYRRALAREGLIMNNNSINTVVVNSQEKTPAPAPAPNNEDEIDDLAEKNTQQILFELAISDLSTCLELFPEKLTKQQSKMKTAAKEALERCTISLEQFKVPNSKYLNKQKEEKESPVSSDTISSSSANVENSLEEGQVVAAATTSAEASALSSTQLPAKNNGIDNTIATKNVVASLTTDVAHSKVTPSPSRQRQDVIRLLMSRQMQAEQQQKKKEEDDDKVTTQQQLPRYAALDGEAYFLLNWNWWRKWCHEVDFFYTSSSEESSSLTTATSTTATTNTVNKKSANALGKRQREVLRFLPPGASIPATMEKHKHISSSSSNSDDDSSASTSSSESLEDEDILGPIDNSDLIFFAKSSSSSHHDNNDTLLRQWGNHDILRVDSSVADAKKDREDDETDNTSTKKEDGTSLSMVSSSLQQHPSPSLRPNLVRGYHYEILPREVYNALRVWYNEVTPSICRRAMVNVKHGNNTFGQGGDDISTDDNEVLLPLYYNSNSPGEAVLGNGNTLLGNGNVHDADPTRRFCGACGTPDSKARCTRCLAVHYCDRVCQESHWSFHKTICKKIAAERQKNKNQNNGNNVNGGELYQSFVNHAMHSHNPVWGRVGLNNLGNTCFMNSAIQCLSHSTPLTRYFLSNKFKTDLNATNPLGTGGKLANAYQAAMKDIWMMDSGGKKYTCISPTTLKRAIAMFAPRFAGCSQHDAQEFLAYLLDGLHEDLNRIKKAPYVEMPDVTDGQNMAIAGAEAWDAHLRRNDSLVMDTFYGQFKSTCVCPRCNRVSVSFDAFNHVSLEIPQQQNMVRPLQFLFVPSAAVALSLKGNSSLPPSVRYGVTVRRNEFIGDARRALSELCRVPPNKLAICDVYEHAIYEILQDGKPVSTIRPTDVLVAFEVDAYTNTTIHTIATNIKKYDATPESDAADKELKDKNDPTDKVAFGYPFLTSFHAGYTCKQVYDHIWNQVRLMLGYQKTSKGSNKKAKKKAFEKRLRSALHIRVVDNAGKSRPLFSTTKAQQNDQTTYSHGDVPFSSILPSTSDEKIAKYLGKDCTEQFLFVHLEWEDEKEVKAHTDGDGKQIVPFINPDQFLHYEDHPSLAETIQNNQGMNGTKGVTLEQCFDMFTRPERLDENNKWYCSTCKEHVRAMKTMELWRLPNILVVHLKRFEFKHSFRRDKLDTLVNFPLDSLDMTKHCAKSREQLPDCGQYHFVEDRLPAVYDLFGVTNHFGRMGFGHYTAFARKWDEDGMSKDWALFDDSSVRSVGDGQGIITPAAYVLFYRRRAFT